MHSDGRVQNTGEQTEISHSPEILHGIFEFAPDAILLVDGGGRIAMANAQAFRMFGYAPSELVGNLVEVLVPQRLAARHVKHRSGYHASPRTRPMGAGIDLFGKRKDGTEFPVDIMLSPIETERGRLILGVVRDVTERKRMEVEALHVRETYLKEVHHRVKNNLQVISSLLFLQTVHTPDPKVLEILKESQSRVKSIALIHEKLYRSAELVRLDFAGYVRDLVTDLFRSYGMDQRGISATVRVENVSLEIDTAIPCGLIINELVSNVLKHAFPNGRSGNVMVELEPAGDRRFNLLVKDNGVGLPEGFDWRASASLGLKLVNDLTRQLDGTIRVDTANGGTAFHITFREVQYKERA
ncbi:MAG: hypothetical protein AMXMBFR82_49560 [Candidatus Hydrogenedentota bacterium]